MCLSNKYKQHNNFIGDYCDYKTVQDSVYTIDISWDSCVEWPDFNNCSVQRTTLCVYIYIYFYMFLFSFFKLVLD